MAGVATDPPRTVMPWEPCARASCGSAIGPPARSPSHPSKVVDACSSDAAHRTTPHTSEPDARIVALPMAPDV